MDSDEQRLGVVVVTHGQLAPELVNGAEMITGALVRFDAVGLGIAIEPSVGVWVCELFVDYASGVTGMLPPRWHPW